MRQKNIAKTAAIFGKNTNKCNKMWQISTKNVTKMWHVSWQHFASHVIITHYFLQSL